MKDLAPYRSRLCFKLCYTTPVITYNTPKMSTVSYGEGSKYLNGITRQVMNDIFKLRKNTYDLRNFHLFENQNPKTKRYVLDCIAHLVSQIWHTFPIEIRDSVLLKTFKHKKKKCGIAIRAHVTVARLLITT